MVRVFAMLKVIVPGTLMVSVLGCLDTDRMSILGASAGPLVRSSQRASKASGKPNVEEPDDEADAVPRHVYRASDMQLAPCARLDEAGAIVGKECEGGFVVFGPYASISGKSDLRVRFEIESDDELVLSSDVVSNMGALRHGELGNQTVRADAKRQLRYRAQLAEGAEAVEARIFVRPGDDANFKISNLEIAVR